LAEHHRSVAQAPRGAFREVAQSVSSVEREPTAEEREKIAARRGVAKRGEEVDQGSAHAIGGNDRNGDIRYPFRNSCQSSGSIDYGKMSVLAHGLVQLAQVIEGNRRVGMFWPDFLLDSETFLVERFGFGVLAHCLVQRGHAKEALRRVGMFRTKDLLPDPERFLVERFGFGVLAHSPVQLHGTSKQFANFPHPHFVVAKKCGTLGRTKFGNMENQIKQRYLADRTSSLDGE
jgi:hypothetical protein